MRKYMLIITVITLPLLGIKAEAKPLPHGSIEIYPMEVRCTACNRIENISFERLERTSCSYSYVTEFWCNEHINGGHGYFKLNDCGGQIVFAPVSVKIPERGIKFSVEDRLKNIECNYCKQLFTMEESAKHICPQKEKTYINSLKIYKPDEYNRYSQCFHCLEVFAYRSSNNLNYKGKYCIKTDTKAEAKEKIFLKERIMEHPCYQGVRDLIEKQINIDVETEKAKIAEIEREEKAAKKKDLILISVVVALSLFVVLGFFLGLFSVLDIPVMKDNERQ